MKKKFFASLLALLTVFSLSTAAFAEDEVDNNPAPLADQIGPDADDSSQGEWTCDPFGKCGYTKPNYLSGYTTLGSEYFYFTSWTVGNWDTQVGDMTFSSTGGYFQINMKAQTVSSYATGTTPAVQVELWEDDGSTGDDRVKTWLLYPHTYDQYMKVDANPWKDGLNGKAEFYLKVTNNYAINGSKGYFYFYD